MLQTERATQGDPDSLPILREQVEMVEATRHLSVEKSP